MNIVILITIFVVGFILLVLYSLIRVSSEAERYYEKLDQENQIKEKKQNGK
ncbi:hypothetical protein [[Clostridium] fimetarium]|uniref:Uncharacterized protein n=1 Tax=[Clostridium] fimetarium TaxID=99656 RepID=A0A1I0NIR4_9FIRM|nr:hypothetical protein [[Clostridium] fimetarium]SEW01083.1 hypothetical protein SAMN05421659_103125 [[Clostridium] fimetarium]